MNKESIRILHIITGLNNGGAEMVLYRLIETDTKHQHIVISMMEEGKYGSKLNKLGIIVHCLNMPRGKITLSSLFKLWLLIKNYKPNVVQTWMYHADLIGGLIARLAGVKKVLWGIRNSNLSSKNTSLSTRLVARACALLSYIVPNKIISCAIQAAESHQAIGYARKRFVVIHNGYNFKHFAPDDVARKRLREQLNLSSVFPILGMVGRFDPLKDHENLIKALGIIKSKGIRFQCLLVGLNMSIDNKPLVDLLNQEKIQDDILLLEQRDDIPSIMNTLDLHILSSLGEAFPNVLAEAMVCGTPCVTTNVGDAHLIVSDTGWVVPPSNSFALAEVITIALEEWKNYPTVWKNRQKAARNQIIEKFSIERMVDAYHQIWYED